jgi:glycosyltransferase involved in cell wall biosynthesis
MRVGIDATSWVNRRGFGRFTRNAVGRLVRQDAETRYVLVIDESSADGADLPEEVEIRRVRVSRPPTEAAAAGSSRSLADLMRLTRAVRRERLDAFLFPSLYTWFPVVGTPTVVGVHDTIIEELPGLTVPSRRNRLAASVKHRAGIRGATTLFTVSEYSRRTIAARFGMPAERLHVVPEAPDPIFSPRSGDVLARGLASVQLDPGDRFFLFFGGVSPHKNLETLVDAYARLRAERGPTVPLLVIAGELDGAAYLSSTTAVRERIAGQGLESAVRLPGYVSDETLACLCSSATAVVLPSLAEGFGLPAVEAAACGAALALSELPTHRETLGDAALYFAPTDVGALTATLHRLGRDESLRRDLSTRAREAVADLSWDAAARKLQALIAMTARSRRDR